MDNKLTKEWFLKTKWGRVAMISWGERARPGALLVHGYLDSAAVFQPLVALLPDTYYYVGFDFPAALYHHLYPGKIEKIISFDPVFAIAQYYYMDETHGDWYKWFYEYYYDHYNIYHHAPPRLFTYEQLIEGAMAIRRLRREQAKVLLSRSLVPVENGLYRLSTQPMMRRLVHMPTYKDFLLHILTHNSPPTLVFHGSKTEMTEEEKDFTRQFQAGRDRPRVVDVYIKAHHYLHLTHPGEAVPHIVEFLNKKCFVAKI